MKTYSKYKKLSKKYNWKLILQSVDHYVQALICPGTHPNKCLYQQFWVSFRKIHLKTFLKIQSLTRDQWVKLLGIHWPRIFAIHINQSGFNVNHAHLYVLARALVDDLLIKHLVCGYQGAGRIVSRHNLHGDIVIHSKQSDEASDGENQMMVQCWCGSSLAMCVILHVLNSLAPGKFQFYFR